MALFINNKEISAIQLGRRVVTAIWLGPALVWELVKTKSCFGRGFWVREKPWIGTDAWRRN